MVRRGAICLARFGVSYYEIGDALGVYHSTVSKWARSADIVRGKGGGCAARNNAARSSDAAHKRMERVRDAIGERFEVVRETRKDWFVLRCRECGHEFERFIDLRYRTECPECMRREVERREIERETASMRRALVRAFRGVLRVKEREEREREFLDTVHVCKECGREFTLRELRESNPWNYTVNPTFCSRECGKRWHKRNTDYRRRELKSSGVGVSLEKLIERDGNTCYICGGKCDKDDFKVVEGSFIAGPSYPSVDHVVPLCEGGENSPSNARLAHCLCNALKSNGTVEDARRRIRERVGYISSPAAAQATPAA